MTRGHRRGSHGKGWRLLWVGWAGALSLATAASEAPRRLSVSDAVDLGLERAFDVRIADSQARETGTQVGAAWSQVLPEVNVGFSYSRTVSENSITLPPGLDLGNLPFGQDNSYNTGLSWQQPLYRPGAVRGIRIARDYFRAAQDQSTEARLATVLNICLTYYDAVLAAQLATIAEAQIGQFEAELKDIRLRRQAGDASDLDVSRAEVNRANIEPQLTDALNAQDASMLALKQLINLDPKEEILLTDPLRTEGFEPVQDAELDALTGASAQHRAAVRAAERQVTIRRAEVRQARAAYFPELDAVGNLGFQSYPEDPIPERREWQDNWTVGVQLSIPIFDGGRRRASVAAAKERAAQAALRLDQLLLSVRTEVETWRIRLKRAESLIASRGLASREAARVYDLIGLSFRSGSATYLDLTDARTNLRTARANEVRTLHDYLAAYLNLIRTVGVPAEAFAQAQTLQSHRALGGGASSEPSAAESGESKR